MCRFGSSTKLIFCHELNQLRFSNTLSLQYHVKTTNDFFNIFWLLNSWVALRPKKM